MTDTDQKVRSAFSSGRNFRPQHFELYRACISNAYDLISEADILLKQDHHARAYALAFTAAEEIGKALAVADWIYDQIPEEEFHDVFKKHHIKQSYLENVFCAALGEEERDQAALKADFIFRMSALYVDKANDGSPKCPMNIIKRETALRMIEKVKEYLGFIISAEWLNSPKIGAKALLK
jgi:AbiV family abortive infection protein